MAQTPLESVQDDAYGVCIWVRRVEARIGLLSALVEEHVEASPGEGQSCPRAKMSTLICDIERDLEHIKNEVKEILNTDEDDMAEEAKEDVIEDEQKRLQAVG